MHRTNTISFLAPFSPHKKKADLQREASEHQLRVARRKLVVEAESERAVKAETLQMQVHPETRFTFLLPITLACVAGYAAVCCNRVARDRECAVPMLYIPDVP